MQSCASAERNHEGMALEIRVERFHFFRYFLVEFLTIF